MLKFVFTHRCVIWFLHEEIAEQAKIKSILYLVTIFIPLILDFFIKHKIEISRTIPVFLSKPLQADECLIQQFPLELF